MTRQKMKFGGGYFPPPQGNFPQSYPGFGIGGGGGPQGLVIPSFEVPFADLGAGVVDTTEIRTNATPTFTRATTAWTRLASGLWGEVASGSPRSYYTAGGVYGGWFAECTTRTNRCLYARDLTNAAWVSGGGGVATAKTQTGIDGVENSCSLMTASGADGTLLQSIVSASATRVFSCHIQRSVGTGTLFMTLDGGTGWTDVTAQVGSGVFLIAQITQAAVTNPVVGFKISTTGDAFIVDMCQEETGILASSPIPTTTASETRNRDILTYPIGNISNTVGSSFAESIPFAIIATGSTFQTMIGGDTAHSPSVLRISTSTAYGMSDGTTAITKSVTPSLVTPIKAASSWGAAGIRVTASGQVVATGVFDGNMGISGSVHIGDTGSGSSAFFGAIRGVKIFNRQLSDSQLAAITA